MEHIYTHVKTGNYYKKLFEALDCTNGNTCGRSMVVYQSIVSDNKYCRSLEEFEELFKLVPTQN